MLKKRIIAALDVRGGKVIKNVQYFNDSKTIGDPAELAQKYEAQGVNEIALLDITATDEGRGTMYELVEKVAAAVKIPVTAGGGVRTVDDFKKLFLLGAAKVFVNSGAVTNPALIRDASQAFGPERVVAAIDAKLADGAYKVFTSGGHNNTGLDLIKWAKKCAADGAGEILLTSMDGDGMRNGYDIPMLKAVVESVSIPVTASGGCGSVAHIIDAFKQTGCDAALVASLLHFGTATAGEIKTELERNGMTC